MAAIIWISGVFACLIIVGIVTLIQTQYAKITGHYTKGFFGKLWQKLQKLSPDQGFVLIAVSLFWPATLVVISIIGGCKFAKRVTAHCIWKLLPKEERVQITLGVKEEIK